MQTLGDSTGGGLGDSRDLLTSMEVSVGEEEGLVTCWGEAQRAHAAPEYVRTFLTLHDVTYHICQNCS
jgi:hypothetical protein